MSTQKVTSNLSPLRREIRLTTGINPYAAGSVLVEFGNTKVHVTATLENSVPRWLKDQGRGWVTAEYSMLPASTHERIRRERSKVGGRTQEIQRLIGRSLRAAVDLEKLGENSITIDCDVLVADGGTRTASVTGGFVALGLACDKLLNEKVISESPIQRQIAAISIGIDKNGKIVGDLDYDLDSTCNTDLNLVLTSEGQFVEVQGTAEGVPYTMEQLQEMLELGQSMLKPVFDLQKQALGQ